MSDTSASSRLKALAWIAQPGRTWNTMSAFTIVEEADRTLSSSISGRGPNQRTRRLPERRFSWWTAAPAEKAPSIARCGRLRVRGR
jgi:hypothetical protein